MLLGIGIQPFEKLRSGRVLEFDGVGESENIVPIVFNKFGINVKLRQYFVAEILINFAFFK